MAESVVAASHKLGQRLGDAAGCLNAFEHHGQATATAASRPETANTAKPDAETDLSCLDM
jgi:hypothetical protein